MGVNANNSSKVVQTNKIVGDAGRIVIESNYEKDGLGSQILVDKSRMSLQDKFKNFLTFKAGGIVLRSIADLNIDIGKNYIFTVKGDAQYVYCGNKHEYIQGDSTQLRGDHSTGGRQASKNLQKILKEVHDKKKEAFENAGPTEVACPHCKAKLLTDRSSAVAQSILNTLQKYIFAYTPFNITKLSKYLGLLINPFLSQTTSLSLSNGKGCKHPNCKNGIMKSNGKNYDKANETARKEIEARQDEITAQEEKLKPNSSVQHYSGNTVIKCGHDMWDADPYAKGYGPPMVTGFEANQREMYYSQKGSRKEAYYHIGVDSPPDGDLGIEAAVRIHMEAGAGGIQMSTNGHGSWEAGSHTFVSNKGDTHLASAGQMTLKGKQVKIDGNDRTGDDGIQLNAHGVFATGKLSVGGDLGVKGLLRAEGGVYTPTIITRSTQHQTEVNSACDPVSHTPTWNTPPPLSNGDQAKQYNIFSEALQILNTILDGLDYILTLAWLQNAITRAINGVKVQTILDNQNLPTGYFLAWNYMAQKPLATFHIDPDTGTLVEGIVVPAFGPIYNSPHNHPQISGDHNHFHEHPATISYSTTKGLHANSPSPSHVPTPCPEPCGTMPGPQTMGDSCGGGGAAFINATNSNIETAITTRNSYYGIDGSDAFQGTNYVQTSAVFNSDGTFQEDPQTGLETILC
jgi:hypothetical protein